ALTEVPELLDDPQAWLQMLRDDDPRVQHAAVLAYFAPKVPWLDAARRLIERGPARSKDTYLRQAATLLLAERATLKQLDNLCAEEDAASRLAGVLAVGFRLAMPPATQPIPDRLTLAKLREDAAYVI